MKEVKGTYWEVKDTHFNLPGHPIMHLKASIKEKRNHKGRLNRKMLNNTEPSPSVSLNRNISFLVQPSIMSYGYDRQTLTSIS